MGSSQSKQYALVCPCIQKTAYSLSRLNIPDVFFKYQCSVHKEWWDSTESNVVGDVKCFLLQDILLTGSEDVSRWRETYYGAPLDEIIQILSQCELLMPGDNDFNGQEVITRKNELSGCLVTYRTVEGADQNVTYTDVEGGEIRLKIFLQLRQRKFRGFRIPFSAMFSTNRRGSTIIESIVVRVQQCKSLMLPVITTPTQNLYVMKYQCRTQQQAYNFLKTYSVPPAMLNSAHNRCFCRECYADSRPKFKVSGGENYTIPVGWSRFGLAVNPVFAMMNDIWVTWNTAYHGCKVENVESILKHRTLLIPNDYLSDGRRLGVTNSSDKNQSSYFLTPSIDFAAHPRFGEYARVNDLVFQVAIAFKVRPGTISRQPESAGTRRRQPAGANDVGIRMERRRVQFDYSIIPQNDIEWFSSRRGCVHPYGLLIRIITDHQLEQVSGP